MTNIILEVALKDILPYIAPLIFILSAFAVGDHLIDFVRNAFIKSAYGKSRRSG